MAVPAWLVDLGDASVWTATIFVLLWVLQYTASSPWWRDPVGRTIVAKDLALLLLLIPSVLLMVWPMVFDPLSAELLGIASLTGVSATMVWRSVVWYRIRKPWFLRRSDDMDSVDTSATQGRDSEL